MSREKAIEQVREKCQDQPAFHVAVSLQEQLNSQTEELEKLREAAVRVADRSPVSYDDFSVGFSYQCDMCGGVGHDSDVKHDQDCAWTALRSVVEKKGGN